jgi:uncharacterized protein YdiU (UPF0061 family)
MTLFYRALADVPIEEGASAEERTLPLLDAYYEPPSPSTLERLGKWLERYLHRVRAEAWAERALVMRKANPKYVLRNYLAQEAIDAAEGGDFSLVRELGEAVKRPYDDAPEHARFASKRPDWARSRPGCSMLSCSS